MSPANFYEFELVAIYPALHTRQIDRHLVTTKCGALGTPKRVFPLVSTLIFAAVTKHSLYLVGYNVRK